MKNTEPHALSAALPAGPRHGAASCRAVPLVLGQQPCQDEAPPAEEVIMVEGMKIFFVLHRLLPSGNRERYPSCTLLHPILGRYLNRLW